MLFAIGAVEFPDILRVGIENQQMSCHETLLSCMGVTQREALWARRLRAWGTNSGPVHSADRRTSTRKKVRVAGSPRRGSDIGKLISLEPAGKRARERLLSVNRQAHALRCGKSGVASPPSDQGVERAVNAHRLGKAGILRAQ